MPSWLCHNDRGSVHLDSDRFDSDDGTNRMPRTALHCSIPHRPFSTHDSFMSTEHGQRFAPVPRAVDGTALIHVRLDST
jgi:hypothetical protein